jgi:uncharacterized OsmC-like protein
MHSYEVKLIRVDSSISTARCKDAEIAVDSDPTGRVDAFNPAELLLAALGACMLKNIERVAPILKFQFDGVHVMVRGERQDVPPRLRRITYRIVVKTGESDQRLALLQRNVRQFGTVFNTIAAGTPIEGSIERADVTSETGPTA